MRLYLVLRTSEYAYPHHSIHTGLIPQLTSRFSCTSCQLSLFLNSLLFTILYLHRMLSNVMCLLRADYQYTHTHARTHTPTGSAVAPRPASSPFGPHPFGPLCGFIPDPALLAIITGHVLPLTSAALAPLGSAFIAHRVLRSHLLPYTSTGLMLPRH